MSLSSLSLCLSVSLSAVGAPITVKFCSVHSENVVAKKRDPASLLLQRLHAHSVRLDVNFVGYDFNMAANDHQRALYRCEALAHWTKPRLTARASFACHGTRFSGGSTSTFATSSQTSSWAWPSGTRRPTSLCFSTCGQHLPGNHSVMRG